MTEELLIGKTILTTLALSQFACVFGLRMGRIKGSRQLQLQSIVLLLVLRAFLPLDSPFRLLLAMIFIFVGANYLHLATFGNYPVVWNISFLSLLSAWILFAITGYLKRSILILSSFILLLCITLFFLIYSTKFFKRMRSALVPVIFGQYVLWIIVCAVEVLSGSCRTDMDLWLSIFSAVMIGYLMFREVVCNPWILKKPNKIPAGERIIYRRTVSRLERAERELLIKEKFIVSGYLAAGVVHELKNLITNIKLCVEYGLSRAEVKNKNMSMNAILDSIEMGKKSVASLLESLILGARKEVENVRLSECLGTLVTAFRSSYRTEQIYFALKVESVPDIMIRKSEFEQVVMNIVRNCVRVFCERHTERRTVTLALYQDGLTVVTEIVDNAGGIAEDLQGILFNPPSESSKRGIGLYLAKELIEENGGRIEYHPVEGGSCFRIIFNIDN